MSVKTRLPHFSLHYTVCKGTVIVHSFTALDNNNNDNNKGNNKSNDNSCKNNDNNNNNNKNNEDRWLYPHMARLRPLVSLVSLLL